MGPDCARRNNAAATALRCGVPISLHSDSPVTPLGLLHTVQHAVTRRTQSGRVMGEHERITAQQALEAVTIGAALISSRGENTIELTKGCICCQITDDVQRTRTALGPAVRPRPRGL
ncbi:amidohydrolase family protein [Kocuria sp. CPCC 204721]|uniref:amidohydrolase family protein n=1 Tax=Kocuria sp. CPCC 204721 TaxID=3073548 RepID=UPI0034D50BDA